MILMSCPRDGAALAQKMVGEGAHACPKCEGSFFVGGVLFATLGIAGDPASWDRPETGGVVRKSTLVCPHCKTGHMHAQDVAHEGKHVEIDRCGKCRGIWLDKSEQDTLVAIGTLLTPLREAEQAKAQAELAKLGDVDVMTRWKTWKVAVVLAVIGVVVTGVTMYLLKKPEIERQEQRTRARESEGCPCGCDHSKAMAAELRTKGGSAASKAIDKTLETISARENVGYITERMIQHRLRMLDLASELSSASPSAHAEPVSADIDVLLASMNAASSYQERHPLERALYAMGDSALPRLDAIVHAHRQPQLEPFASHAQQTILARSARTKSIVPVADDTLRVSAELIVHGERTEIVNGEPKQITSSFRLWLAIENLTNDEQTLTVPSIRARQIDCPISRWYEEDGDGTPWNGALHAKQKIAVNVIGDIPQHLKPGSDVDAKIVLGSLAIETHAKAAGVIHLQVR